MSPESPESKMSSNIFPSETLPGATPRDPKLEAALQQAKGAPDSLRSDAELNARITEVEGWIAVIRGELDQARLVFQQSHEHALKAFGPYHTKTMDALRATFSISTRTSIVAMHCSMQWRRRCCSPRAWRMRIASSVACVRSRWSVSVQKNTCSFVRFFSLV